jgi:3-dehydroquinate dehydratase / shikimate dehydrogenase
MPMTPTLLVSTVAETSHAALLARREEEAGHADIIELRLDALREPIDVRRAIAGRTMPVIVTCRPTWEGGRFEGSEEGRRRVLLEALRAGAEYVDVEWRAGFTDVVAARGGKGVVLSLHDFDGVTVDLAAQVGAMLAQGTDIVKVAVTARRLDDCVRLARTAGIADGRSLAAVAMGPSGLATRLLPGRFGSCWSYAGNAAPGQVPAREMLKRFRFREVGASTRIYGLAGKTVGKSLSPAMHNAWFRAAGVDAVYVPLETDCADDLLAFAEWLGVRGVSVTAPLKRAMFDRVTLRDAVAERVGAVNTMVRHSDRWSATNTDVSGFSAPLRARGVDLHNRRAAILGAGGAARAVAVALSDAGARVSVHARQLHAAREVASLAGGRAVDGWPSPGDWDLLVNATPHDWRGLTPRLFGPDCRGAWVYDLVSNPPQTPLLEQAAAAGCGTISGLEMLVAQAEAQAAWWTHRQPEPGLMRRAALDALRTSHPDRGTTCE